MFERNLQEADTGDVAAGAIETTRPNLIGSLPCTKTIGMVEVAAFAATAETTPPQKSLY
jgi:hypothetical protein